MNKLLQLFDPSFLSSLALQTGVIVRQRKLCILDLLRIWVFSDCYTSLSLLCDQLLEQGIFIRKQSLNARFTSQATVFLSSLAASIMKLKLVEPLELKWADQFGRVMLMDSTIGSLYPACKQKFPGFGGNASDAAFKVQYCFDLLNGEVEELYLLPGKKTDSGYQIEPIDANDLWLYDMGYCNGPNLRSIIKKQAWFITRFKYKTATFVRKGNGFEPIDLHKQIEKMKEGQIWDQKIYLTREKIPVRLIMQRIPEKISEENRRKLKKAKTRRGRNISKQRLAFCDVNAFITNLDQQQLPPDRIADVYRLRWQIELVFKNWKSTFNLDKVPPMKPQRFECCFWGALIKILLAQKFTWYLKTKIWNEHKIEISEIKAAKVLKARWKTLTKLFLEKHRTLTQVLRAFEEAFVRNARKEKRKGRRLPMEIMQEP